MITKSALIADGVRLSYIHTEKFKTNYISFNFIAPVSEDTVHYNSMLPPILMRGSREYPTQALINKRLQYLYSGEIVARNSKFGEYQIFGLKANMLSNRFTPDTDTEKETVELFCQLIFNPLIENGAFDENYTSGEKINLIDTIEAEINDKGKYANSRLLAEMCKDEVFGVSKYGKIENVEKITPSSLYETYKKALSTYPIEIYLVGNMSFDNVVEQFKSCFASIERDVIDIPEAEIITHVGEVKEVEEIEKVKQGKLVLGFRTGYLPEENRYHLLQLFNELYGASPTAKLFLNVREKMSLCYYCRSIISQRSGIMLVSSGIEAKNKEIAKKAILEQLDAIKNGDITDEELESAKKSLRNGYMQIYDSAEAMESWSFFRSLCKISTTPANECEKILSVGIDEIKEIASRIKLDTIYFLRGEES